LKASFMRDHWLGDLLILTLLVGVFFGFGLGGRALWAPDEGRYSEVAREMIVSGDYITPRLDGTAIAQRDAVIGFSTAALF
jgi:4-amino-4-deoxy-L-arabinose transferase-like glycosyltransferase